MYQLLLGKDVSREKLPEAFTVAYRTQKNIGRLEMRKLKRILTSFLAVALVLSNLSFGALTVNAAEVDDTGTNEVVEETTVEETTVEETIVEETVVEETVVEETVVEETTVEETVVEETTVEETMVEETTVEETTEENEGVFENAVSTYSYNASTDANAIAFDAADTTVDWGNATYEYVDGKLKIDFVNAYDQVKIRIPEAIDMSTVTSVKFIVSGQTAPIALKIWGSDSEKEAFCEYNFADGTEYAIVPNLDETISVVGIMGQDVGTVYFEGVEFTVKSQTSTLVFDAADTTVDWGNATYEYVDGKLKIDFVNAYDQVKIRIPEAIDMSTVTSVKFIVSGQTAPIALKIWGSDSEKEAFCEYNFADGTEYAIVPNLDETISVVGIMGQDVGTVYFEGIEFTIQSGSAITYGDNIIVNPYFEDDAETEDDELAVWKIAQGENSVITSATSETAIGDTDITTYGKLDRNAETSTSQDCFSQDITEAVELGEEYKYEFWVMLDAEDYKDAPVDKRKVAFGPYTYDEETDKTSYLGTYSTGVLSGDIEATLEPGVWTKFEGTFNIPADVEKVVIRVIEQGIPNNDYTVYDCVLGDYYLTGVSMQKVNKPKVEIQRDIDPWKTAIVTGLGADAIAGACLGVGGLTDEALTDLAKMHFNAITFENEMKPDATLGSSPSFEEDGVTLKYSFTNADKLLNTIKEWNEADEDPSNDMKIRGHVLVWHSQTPDWFFYEDYDTTKELVDKDTMNTRMQTYINAVVAHYCDPDNGWADMFYGWDVVNEAVSDSYEGLRLASENSKWAAVYGNGNNEFIVNAFKYATAAFKAAGADHIELYYNDYNECGTTKSTAIATLLGQLQTIEENEGSLRIDGMGMQGHHNYADPTAGQIKDAARKYAAALGEGDNIQVTELDVKRSSTYDGTDATLATEHSKQAWRFKEIWDAYKELELEDGVDIGGITMWGIVDKYSWLQSTGSVGGGSTGGAHAPLLFDDDYMAKPAYWAFVDDSQLEPMIQSVTFIQKTTDSFDTGFEYTLAGGEATASFVPMWTEDGLTIKVDVADATANDADTITVYVDTNDTKAEGEFAKVTVARNAEGVTSTDASYSAIIDIPMEGLAITSTLSFDIAVYDADTATTSIFNDKKYTQATTSKYYAEAIMKPYATAAKGTPIVDGQKDEAYLGAEVIPMTIRLGAEANASAQVMWDEYNLYVFAQVEDAVLDNTSSQAHEQDSIEIFVDENNAKADSYQNDDAQYRISYVNDLSINTPDASSKTVKSVAVQTTYGYAIETAFAWTEITPELGDEIGLELQINDAKDGKRTGTLSWYDKSGNGWSTPSVYGTVKLVDNAGYDVEDEDLGDVLVSDLPMGGIDAIPDGLWIAGVNEKPHYYTGSAVVPEIRVYDHKTLLTNKVDYTITCKDNKKVSTATKPAKITVKGKGNYTESVTEEFMILAKNLNDSDIVINDIQTKYTGKVQKPNPVVKYNGKTLKKDTDYTVTYPSDADYKSVGDYTITIKGKGGYVGTRDINLSIDMYLSAVSVGKISAQKYNNGEPVTLKTLPTVKWGNTKLVENVDFTVSYRNNEEVGTATLVLTAAEDSKYVGTKEVTFKITGTSITKATVTGIPKKMPYSGDAITAETEGWGNAIAVKVSGKELPTDAYTIEYSNNTNAGKKATVTITGKADKGYSGTIKKTFEITPYSFADDAKLGESRLVVTSAEDSVPYVKSGAKAAVTSVTYKGTPLVAGKDYKVSYKNNTKLHGGTGTNKVPTVTITGIGNFKGSVTETYAIVQQDIDRLSMKLVDKAFSFKKNAYKSTPKVYDLDGKVLTNNKDYYNIKFTYAEDNSKLVDGSIRNAGEEIGNVLLAQVALMVTRSQSA